MSGVEKCGVYHTQDACADTLEVMNKRLAQDLRNRVRRINHCTPMSPDWKALAEILSHLSQVAVMEAKDIVKREGSVWERDELCVRYLIEETKTNLLMRLMVECKGFLYENESMLPETERGIARLFESSLGELLRCLFTAVEALQTLDMPTMIEYIERVLTAANADPSSEFQAQETLVVYYIHHILVHIERLDEEKVLGLFLSHNILPGVLRHFEAYGTKLGDEGVETYVWLLAELFDTEYFQSKRDRFFAAQEDKKRLALLEPAAKALKGAETDSEKRKKLRGLCDLVIRYK